MPRPRLPYLQREITRHRKTVWYFRRGDGPRTRIRGEYGSKEFNSNYEAALLGTAPTKKPTSSGSLEWLIRRYKESAAWSMLSLATQLQRDNIYKNMIKSAGEQPFLAITRANIIEGRDRRREVPNQANNFIKSMRGLFRWALDAEHIKIDPTRDVKLLNIKTEGFHVWTDEEIAKFEARWPVGTRERLAFDILLYTGLRRGDAALLGPGHVRDGVFSIKTEKNGVEVTAPILPALAKSIAATPIGKTTFISGERGNALTKESFGNYFREACGEAGVPGAAHGLRKAGATRAAEAGVTHSQLKAMFGWDDDKMPTLYTKKADRGRLAKEAMKSLNRSGDDEETNNDSNSH